MFLSIIFLLGNLFIILLSAEGFTNSIEVFGRKFNFSQAVVGSIFAAVGTALPETVLPVVAIFLGAKETAKEIGVGAILGAPFMLTTLAFFLVGLTVFITFLRKKRAFALHAEPKTLKRDLIFFIAMYGLAVVVPIVFGSKFNLPLAILLVLGYFFYVFLTIKSDSKKVGHCEPLLLLKLKMFLGFKKNLKESTFLIFLQIILSLCIMLVGAEGFVKYLEILSKGFGISPLIFTLIFAPIATELPEKFNSISWTIKGKDALAIGNITGAMVFQATFPVSIGLLFTNWELTNMALFSAVIALTSASVVLTEIIFRKKVSPYSILFGGILYLIYIVVLLT